jgi:hypothetical protein
VASQSARRNDIVLRQLKEFLKLPITSGARIRLAGPRSPRQKP